MNINIGSRVILNGWSHYDMGREKNEYIINDIDGDEYLLDNDEWVGIGDITGVIEESPKKTKDDKSFYKMEDVTEIAKSIFGEERVDCSGSDSSYNLTIHFPVIKITNSRNNNHTIHDLFFKVYFAKLNGEVSKADIRVYGMRTSYSLKELTATYTHSHLPAGTNPISFSSFCLGHSDFKVLIGNLCIDLNKELWEMFFYSIEGYLSWESLEGGPYITISNCFNSNGRSISGSQLREEFNRLKRLIPQDLFYYMDELKIHTTSSELLNFYEKESRIRKLTVSNPTNIQYYKDRYVSSFIFKNKSIKFKVIEDNTEDNTFDSEIRTYYNEYLNQDLTNFNKKLIYEHAISNYSSKIPQAIRIS